MLKPESHKSKRSLAISITLAVILIFAVGQSVVWTWFLYTQKTYRQEVLVKHVSLVTEILADMAVTTVESKTSGEIDRLKSHVKRLLRDDEFLTVNVYTSKGNVLLHESVGVEERPESSNPFYIPWHGTHAVALKSHTGESIGRIEVIYSGKGVNADMFKLITVPPIGQAIVFIIIVVAIFTFIHNRIGKPIEVLMDRIGKITSGNLKTEIPEMESSEMGFIADGLRFLVKSLANTGQRLNATANVVNETITKLESNFRNTIDRIKSQTESTNQIASTIRKAEESQRGIYENTTMLSAITSENVASLQEVKANENEIAHRMEDLYKSTDNSYSVVAEMAQTSKVMSKNAQRVLSSVENTSASVEEIIASVREVETSARESSLLAEKVRQDAAQGGVASVDKAVRSMNRIVDKVNRAAEIVRELGNRSKDIQHIVSVMREINEQANMLSINAAILAEQAGEYGKGFSVVADEMRGLSTRTETYTKEIGGIAVKIRNGISEVMSAIDGGIESVKEGNENVYEVGESMSSILESAHTSANMTKMIERATQDQVLALRHIEESIIEVNTMAMEMNKAMDEMNVSAGFIHERVAEVRDVADTTKKGTGELAIGVNMISKNLEMTNDKVSDIASSAEKQQSLNKAISTEIDMVQNESVWILKNMEEVSTSIESLRDDFMALRKEMDVFKR